MESKKFVRPLIFFSMLFMCAMGSGAITSRADGHPNKGEFRIWRVNPSELNNDEKSFLAREGLGNSLQVSAFKISEPSIRKDFLFVYLRDRINCSTHGCGLVSYVRYGDGGYLKMRDKIVVGYPFYARLCDGLLSLVFSPAAGIDASYSEWMINEGQEVKFSRKYTSIKDVFECN